MVNQPEPANDASEQLESADSSNRDTALEQVDRQDAYAESSQERQDTDALRRERAGDGASQPTPESLNFDSIAVNDRTQEIINFTRDRSLQESAREVSAAEDPATVYAELLGERSGDDLETTRYSFDTGAEVERRGDDVVVNKFRDEGGNLWRRLSVLDDSGEALWSAGEGKIDHATVSFNENGDIEYQFEDDTRGTDFIGCGYNPRHPFDPYEIPEPEPVKSEYVRLYNEFPKNDPQNRSSETYYEHDDPEHRHKVTEFNEKDPQNRKSVTEYADTDPEGRISVTEYKDGRTVTRYEDGRVITEPEEAEAPEPRPKSDDSGSEGRGDRQRDSTDRTEQMEQFQQQFQMLMQMLQQIMVLFQQLMQLMKEMQAGGQAAAGDSPSAEAPETPTAPGGRPDAPAEPGEEPDEPGEEPDEPGEEPDAPAEVRDDAERTEQMDQMQKQVEQLQTMLQKVMAMIQQLLKAWGHGGSQEQEEGGADEGGDGATPPSAGTRPRTPTETPPEHQREVPPEGSDSLPDVDDGGDDAATDSEFEIKMENGRPSKIEFDDGRSMDLIYDEDSGELNAFVDEDGSFHWRDGNQWFTRTSDGQVSKDPNKYRIVNGKDFEVEDPDGNKKRLMHDGTIEHENDEGSDQGEDGEEEQSEDPQDRIRRARQRGMVGPPEEDL